jgi:hypothetical protein
MNLAGGLGGIRSRGPSDECVDIRHADVVGIAESAAGGDPLYEAQTKTGGFCCQLSLYERCPAGFDAAKRSYESRFDRGSSVP